MNDHRLSPRPRRGVSIVEAMVAMAIMAFGMLGLVGLQASMRMNADVAKQRAEATRIAEAQIERWRSYATLAQYDAMVANVAASAASGPETTNTSYTWSATVTPDALASSVPPLRTVTVAVSWEDRASQTQSVSLTTQLAGIEPTLIGSIDTQGQGGPVRRIYGRHSAVPRSAQNMGDGTSRYQAPDGSNVGWIIRNATGMITKTCDKTFTTCSPANMALLSGYVTFLLGSTPLSENPSPSGYFPVAVRGSLTAPVTTVDCFTETFSTYVSYTCGMPLQITEVPNFWSGAVNLLDVPPLVLAASSPASDASASHHLVCRYTPENTDTPTGGNAAHPLVYNKVRTALGNQNFLVISAGDGSNMYTCPGDGPSTFVNTNTRQHQPQPPR